jgi:hypothetical protein
VCRVKTLYLIKMNYLQIIKVLIVLLLFIIVLSHRIRKPNFIHIPKNAGSFIEELGLKNGYYWGKYHATMKKRNKNELCSKWHIPYRQMKNNTRNHYSGTNFCIIRSPYDRIVSEYKYVNRFNKDSLSKDNLNKFVYSLADKIKKDKNSQDCHLLPQTDYVYDENGKQICNYIMDFENLERDIYNLNINENLGLTNLDFKKENDTSFSTLSRADLDEKSIAIINEIYQKDFELLKKNKYSL